jgi:hypothetical protein
MNATQLIVRRKQKYQQSILSTLEEAAYVTRKSQTKLERERPTPIIGLKIIKTR